MRSGSRSRKMVHPVRVAPERPSSNAMRWSSLLLVGYALVLLALVVQLVLAELVVRRPATGRRAVPYAAIALTAASTAAGSVLEHAADATPGLRGLVVLCFGVALAGALVVVRAITSLLAAEERRGR